MASLFPISTEGYDSSPNGRRADLFEVPVFLRDCGAPLFGLEEFLAVAIGRMACGNQRDIHFTIDNHTCRSFGGVGMVELE